MVFSDRFDLAWLSGALGIVALILVLYFCTARIRVDETGITKRVLFVFREFIPWDKIRAAKLWRFGSLFDDNNASAREVPWEKDAVLILYADTKVILDVSPIYTDFEHLVTAVSRKGIRVECKNNARPATKDYFRLR